MRKPARVVGFNILAVVVILLAIEGVSRLIRPTDFPEPLITEKMPEWEGTRVYDPLLFWRMRPNITIDGTRFTNSLGLRGPEVPAKRPDEFRILSLGESSTFARRIDYEECYSSLLERGLGSVEGKQVRVINAGVPGYSLFQGYTYLRLHGLDLEPDAVLLYFGYNDFLPVVFRAQRDMISERRMAGATDRELFAQRNSLSYKLTYALQKHSNLARAVTLRWISTTDTLFVDPAVRRVPDEDRRWVLGELNDLSRKHGFRLVIVIPWYREFEDHIDLLRVMESYADVIVVDLPARLRRLYYNKQAYFIDTLHPNSRGHQVIAITIERELRQQWAE
jgi:lysophospholipase L1-like esterase